MDAQLAKKWTTLATTLGRLQADADADDPILGGGNFERITAAALNDIYDVLNWVINNCCPKSDD